MVESSKVTNEELAFIVDGFQESEEQLIDMIDLSETMTNEEVDSFFANFIFGLN